MKTHEYFRKNLDKLRKELREEIYKSFRLKMDIGDSYINKSKTFAIEFANVKTGIMKDCIVYSIYNGSIIMLFAKNKRYCSMPLEEVVDVHDLMYIYYMSINEI